MDNNFFFSFRRLEFSDLRRSQLLSRFGTGLRIGWWFVRIVNQLIIIFAIYDYYHKLDKR